MNIHHLELFYYVAKHNGIAAAVRHIPYGIQQPAVSGQIARLEESLGVKLFQRRPFALSSAGAELFAFIEPFFANMDAAEKKIRGSSAPQLRLAAPTAALEDYVPALLRRVREHFPAFRLSLHEATQADAEKLLEAQEIDLAVACLEKKPRPGLHVKPLLELPLVLLVPKKHPLTDAKTLWQRDSIDETLICFPPTEPGCVQFQRELAQRGVEWFAGIEVNSVALVECYVANGFGIGLVATVPGVPVSKTLRQVPLEGFPPVTVGVMWRGELSPIAQCCLAEIGSVLSEFRP